MVPKTTGTSSVPGSLSLAAPSPFRVGRALDYGLGLRRVCILPLPAGALALPPSISLPQFPPLCTQHPAPKEAFL